MGQPLLNVFLAFLVVGLTDCYPQRRVDELAQECNIASVG